MFHKNKNKYKIIIYKEDYHVIFDCDDFDFIYDDMKKDIWLYDKEENLIGCMLNIIGFIVKEVK